MSRGGHRGMAAPFVDFDVPDQLAAGFTVPTDRRIAFGSSNIHSLTASQSLRLHYFTAPRTATLANVITYSGSTAAGATPTLCRLGVYSIASDGAGTLVASTVNDTALWAATNTVYTKAFSVAMSFVAGQRYALGALVVTAAAIPILVGPATVGAGTADAALASAPRVAAALAAQADLPASFTDASLTDSRIQITCRFT